MITTIFINGHALFEGKQRTELPKLKENIHEISLTFDNEHQMRAFVAKFPKYMGIREGAITSYKGNGEHIVEPYVSCRKMICNKITGEKNEKGDKRMIRFYNTLNDFLSKH